MYVNFSNLEKEGKFNQHLRICSYNCNSLRKKIDNVRKLLNGCDILLLQEILLTSDDSSFMNGIDENFTFLFVPSKLPDSNEGRLLEVWQLCGDNRSIF